MKYNGRVAAVMFVSLAAEAARLGDRLLLDVQHGTTGVLQSGLFHLYAGEAYQGLEDHARAAEYFTWGIAAVADLRQATVTYLLLRLGQSFDLLGKREPALDHYREVAGRKDYFDSVSKAQAGIRRPITREELLKQLRE